MKKGNIYNIYSLYKQYFVVYLKAFLHSQTPSDNFQRYVYRNFYYFPLTFVTLKMVFQYPLMSIENY